MDTPSRPAGAAAPETPDAVTPAWLARQALARCGGAFGLAAAVAPTVAFVVADAIAGLTPAVIVLGVTVAVVLGARIARREPPAAAIGGAAIAAVYALIAALTGEARAFFLVPTLMPAALAVLCLATVLVGRPVTGLLFNRVVGGPPGWPRHRRLRRVYSRSTLVAVLVNVVDFVVQAVLYLGDQPAGLAAAHIAVWPVFAALVAATLVAARRGVLDTAAELTSFPAC